MQMTNSIEIGNMQWIPNYALSFDGTDDYAETSNNFDLVDIVLEVEVKLNEDNGVRNNVIDSYPGTSAQNFYGLSIEDDRTARFIIRDTSGNLVQVLSSTILEVGKWYKIKGKRNAQNQIEIYVDDTLENTNVDDTTTTSISTEKGISLATNPNFGNFGAISLKYALIADGSTKKAEYLFEKGAGTTLYDNVGNNDMDIIGATWQEVE